MADWKQQLLSKITATHKRHVLVRDQDFLLEYPSVQQKIPVDFIVLRCETHLQVRIQFELYQSNTDKRLLIIVPNDYFPMPDLEQRAHFLQISLSDFFPMLDRASLIGQEESLLNALSNQKFYEKQNKEKTLLLIANAAQINATEHERKGVERAFSAIEITLNKIEAENLEDKQADFWLETVQSLGAIYHTLFEHHFTQTEERLEKVVNRLNVGFQQFLTQKYEGLFTRSGLKKPYTVSRVLDYLAALNAPKTALIVLDGMNFWQWEMIAAILFKEKMRVEIDATFAFIPSITAFSRQSLLRGGKPDILQDNSKESTLFKEYWIQNGKQAHQIQYAKFGVNTPFQLENLSNTVEILGLVCNDLDDIMHGTTLGNRQLFSSTRQWLVKSRFPEMLKSLLAAGYTCIITTDHGNLEAQGNGQLRPNDKVGVSSRSKRHINFANRTLMDRFKSQQDMSRFGESGLSLFLKDNTAFTPKSTTVVTHGGSHLWEVIIPFIKITHD
jgi:hypothetical protein